MKIDYFKEGEDAEDKSDWIASITSINPILNGDLPTYFLGFCYDKNKFISAKEGGTLKDKLFIEGCKVFVIL